MKTPQCKKPHEIIYIYISPQNLKLCVCVCVWFEALSYQLLRRPAVAIFRIQLISVYSIHILKEKNTIYLKLDLN